jgi:hypothetical protein
MVDCRTKTISVFVEIQATVIHSSKVRQANEKLDLESCAKRATVPCSSSNVLLAKMCSKEFSSFPSALVHTVIGRPFTFDTFLVIVAELCRFRFAVYQGSLFLVL